MKIKFKNRYRDQPRKY